MLKLDNKAQVGIKIYTQDKKALTEVFKNLKKSIKNFSFVRLPTKYNKVVICPAVSGRGYSTFRKYHTSLKKAICIIYNIKDLQNATKCIGIKNIYFETVVK